MKRSLCCCIFALLFASTGFAITIVGHIVPRSGVPSGEIYRVEVTGTNVSSVNTDQNGKYILTVPSNWTGRVTPVEDGFYFLNASNTSLTYREYDGLNNTITQYQDFQMYYNPVIKGSVAFITGTPQTVQITASSGEEIIATTTTGSGGTYSLPVPYRWSGIIAAQLDGYSFTPTQRTYSNVTNALTQYQNFDARILPSISGAVTTAGGSGIENVEISITGGIQSVYTNSSGAYTFTCPTSPWNGTVTPIKEGYFFDPVNRLHSNITSNQSNQNFTGYLPPVITGTITVYNGTPEGVLITASNGGGTAITAFNGTYELTVPYNWSGTLTPTKDGYYFNPASNTYENLKQDRIANYSGGLLPTISGIISTGAGNRIEGINVTASGSAGSATTGIDGIYSISVPQGWSGTVTPSKSGYTFDPANKEFINVTSDKMWDFTGTAPLSISGSIHTEQGTGIVGVIVLANNGGSIDLTNVNGYYQLSVPAGWSGTVSVRRTGFTFEPQERSYTDLQTNQFDQGFEGLLHNMKIYCWGDDVYGQCEGPDDNQYITAVAAGHSHTLSVNADGQVDAWGDNTYGQSNWPGDNSNFISVAAGATHSLALKKDGSISAWGNNSDGQSNVPTSNIDYLLIAAGDSHSLALKSGGSITAWGANDFGQTSVPSPNENFTGIAAGQNFSMGLKSDGSIVTWGDNTYGQLDVPAPNAGFIAIAAGAQHALGLKIDGTIEAWGFNGNGQCNVPDPNENFIAIAAGLRHSLALKSDGSTVGWGNDAFGQTTQQTTPNQDFVILRAGGWHSAAVKMVVDLSGNGCINNEDFVIFSNQWLREDCTYPDYCQGADFQPDGQVNLDDLSMLSSYWLSECQ